MSTVTEKPKKNVPDEVMLHWAQTRIVAVHLPQSGSMLSQLSAPDARMTPEQLEAEQRKQQAVTIVPGTHAYPAADWNAIKDHPTIKALMRDDQLKVVTNAMVGKNADAANAEEPSATMPGSLDKVGTANALTLVEGCTDLDLLKRWLDREKSGQKRTSIVNALESQVALVKDTDARFKGE